MTEIVKASTAIEAKQEWMERLKPETVRSMLVRGNGEVSDQEVALFIAKCQSMNLNPFNDEAYLIKYKSYNGKEQPAQVITAAKVFDERASVHPDYDGSVQGVVIYDSQNKEILRRRGQAFYPPREVLLGGWAEVFFKSKTHSSYSEVNLKDFHTGKSTWNKMPAVMIVKVADAFAKRKAFPTEFAGLYISEEMQQSQPAEDFEVVEAPAVEAYEPTEKLVNEGKVEMIKNSIVALGMNAALRNKHLKRLGVKSFEELTESAADEFIEQLDAALIEKHNKDTQEIAEAVGGEIVDEEGFSYEVVEGEGL